MICEQDWLKIVLQRANTIKKQQTIERNQTSDFVQKEIEQQNMAKMEKVMAELRENIEKALAKNILVVRIMLLGTDVKKYNLKCLSGASLMVAERCRQLGLKVVLDVNENDYCYLAVKLA